MLSLLFVVCLRKFKHKMANPSLNAGVTVTRIKRHAEHVKLCQCFVHFTVMSYVRELGGGNLTQNHDQKVSGHRNEVKIRAFI